MMDDSMLKVGGKPFYCSCGANVFHKGRKPGLWVCNGCDSEYADETYDSRKTNADHIRAMSDEELADWAINEVPSIGKYYTDSRLGLLDWLQQPAEED